MTPAPLSESQSVAAVETAAGHLAHILEHALHYSAEQQAVVVYDKESELSRLLVEAYSACLPGAQVMAFDASQAEAVLATFDALRPKDLVVLIQSTSFRLDKFRIRIELFRRGLKVIEHPHLARMTGSEALIYVDALAYDRDYYHGVGHGLKARIDQAAEGVVETGGGRLVFPAGFEPAKLNIGDYTGMQNVGGQYPIGEVFTESRELGAVHGRLTIACFGDTAFTVNRPEQPITLLVEAGRVVGVERSTPEFDAVLASITEDEGEVWVRELGFGMNRAMSHQRTVRDIGTFERMCGIHMSLGAKHATYNKPEIRKKTARYHVDVFAQTESVLLDGQAVFRDGAWVV